MIRHSSPLWRRNRLLVRPLQAYCTRLNSDINKPSPSSQWSAPQKNDSSPGLETFHDTQYEFPRNPKYNIPIHVREKSNENFFVRYRKFLPIVVSVAIGTWGLYTIYYFTNPEAGKSAEGQKLLSPDYFTEFMITNRKDVDGAHFVIELTPKNKDDIKNKYFNKKGFWDGSRLWSVEVKQPEIMVVRKYTPLPLVLEDPLEFSSENRSEKGTSPQSPMIRLSSDKSDAAKFCLYIKKYGSGEVARWISRKPVGSILELRGPFTEYQFPATPLDKHEHLQRPKMQNIPSKVAADPFLAPDCPFPMPDNMAFYAAGTGVAPVLQTLLSENPFKGHIDMHYSFRDRREVPEEFQTLFYFLEKLGRVTLHTYEDVQGQFVSGQDIKTPGVPNEKERKRDKSIEHDIKREKLIEQKMEELRKKREGANTPTATSTTENSPADTTNATENATVTAGVSKPAPEPTAQPEQPVERESRTKKLNKLQDAYYSSALQQAYALRDTPKKNPTVALVCGPDGYVSYVAGPKPTEVTQGAVGGLLGEKGWDETNVFKL